MPGRASPGPARRPATSSRRCGSSKALCAATFEELDTSERFDLVHVVDCLYYVPDAAAALSRARRLLAPGGRLVVFHAPRGALNALAARFYDKLYKRPTLFPEEVAALCESERWPVPRARLEAGQGEGEGRP